MQLTNTLLKERLGLIGLAGDRKLDLTESAGQLGCLPRTFVVGFAMHGMAGQRLLLVDTADCELGG